ncbi:MAG: PQQ-binding-like beta-propeller repeat protein [Phycisphaeraceae bacterium]
MALCLGSVAGVTVPTYSQNVEFEVRQAVQALPAEQVDSEDELDLLNTQPGFQLRTDEDLSKRIGELNKQLDAKDWGQAFRLLTDLGDDRLDTMVPIGDDGLYKGVQVQVQQSLLTMPPDGRRAFQLYFDGQAREMLAQVREHPRPGSDEQLGLARKLVDRMLASSIGGEAADLLGDLYFERGQFAQARRCWGLALNQGSATGQDALQLQTKIALAMIRADDRPAANAYYTQLKARYGRATVQIAGRDVDALDTLGALLEGQPGPDTAQTGPNDRPIKLPEAGTDPAWRRVFVNEATRAKFTRNPGQNRYYYRGIQDLHAIVPEVVADKTRLYFQWVGTVFAIDLQTGKIKWVQGSLAESAQSLNERMNNNGGDPRNYRIALSDDKVLVTLASRAGGFSQFKITAHNKDNGTQAWDSMFHRDWSLAQDGVAQNDTSVAGQMLVAGNAAYAVVHRATGADCFLRKFNPDTGEVAWTLPLGAADPVTFQYTDIRRMPQPLMTLRDGLLYVLMNNGSLIAVDVAGVEIAWGRRLSPPMGVGQVSSRHGGQFNVNAIEAMNNPNGSGTLLLQGSTLYAKEHLGKELVAVDTFTGRLKWSVDTLDPDAKLVGVDDQRFYLMSEGLQSYWVAGERGRAKTNNNDLGDPKHAGALLLGDQILAIAANRTDASGRLRLFDTDTLDKRASFELGEYFDPQGGRLYRFDDLLVCIDQSQITAIRLDRDQPE